MDKYRSSYNVAGDGSPDQGLYCQASGATNTVTLLAGNYQAKGYHLSFPSNLIFNSLTTNGGASTRIDTLYLAISEAEVADPNMAPELGETTRRRQVVAAFGVAEGTTIPQDSTLDVYAGGTKYIALAAISRPPATAAISQSQVVDLRGAMPGQVLQSITTRNTISSRPKVLVQALNTEGINDTQIGVQAQNGTMAFNVDRLGNVTSAGTFNPFRCASLFPAANDTYDLGASGNAWRNLYVGQTAYLGDSYTSNTYVQGTLAGKNQAGTSTLVFDGVTGNVGIGGAFSTTRALYVTGSTTLFGNTTIQGMDSGLLPVADTTYDLGSSGTRWNNLYAQTGNINNAYLTLIYGLGGGNVTMGTSLVPQTNNTYTLGTSSLGWANIYSTNFTLLAGTLTINAGGLLALPAMQATAGVGTAIVSNSSINPVSNNTKSLGTAALYWAQIYGNTGFFTTANVGSGGLAVSGDITATTAVNLGSSTRSFSNAFINALNLGSLNAVSGSSVSVFAHLYPSTTNTLGGTSNYWSNAYLTTLYTATINPVSTSITIGGTLTPTTSQGGNLGSTALSWASLFINAAYIGGYTTLTGLTVGISGNIAAGTNDNSLYSARAVFATAALGTTAGNSVVNTAWLLNENANAASLRLVDYRGAAGTGAATADQYLAKRVDTTDHGFIGWYNTGGLAAVAGIGLGYGTPNSALPSLLVTAAQVTAYQNVAPSTNNTLTLGTAALTWANIYTQSLTVNGTFSIGTFSATQVASNLIPSVTNTYDLGSTSKYWNNLYGTTVNGVQGSFSADGGSASTGAVAFTLAPTTLGLNATSTRMQLNCGYYGATNIEFLQNGSAYFTFQSTTYTIPSTGAAFYFNDKYNNTTGFQYLGVTKAWGFYGNSMFVPALSVNGALSATGISGSSFTLSSTSFLSWQNIWNIFSVSPSGTGSITLINSGPVLIQGGNAGLQAFIPIRLPRQCVLSSFTVGVTGSATGTTFLILRKFSNGSAGAAPTTIDMATNGGVNYGSSGNTQATYNVTTGGTINDGDGTTVCLYVNPATSTSFYLNFFGVTYTTTSVTSIRG